MGIVLKGGDERNLAGSGFVPGHGTTYGGVYAGQGPGWMITAGTTPDCRAALAMTGGSGVFIWGTHAQEVIARSLRRGDLAY